MSSTAALVEFDVLGVNDTKMSRERIVSAKRLLFRTYRTMNLLLTRVVDGILVSSKIVRPGKDRVAWLSG
jgi:hypothetical protein